MEKGERDFLAQIPVEGDTYDALQRFIRTVNDTRPAQQVAREYKLSPEQTATLWLLKNSAQSSLSAWVGKWIDEISQYGEKNLPAGLLKTLLVSPWNVDMVTELKDFFNEKAVPLLEKIDQKHIDLLEQLNEKRFVAISDDEKKFVNEEVLQLLFPEDAQTVISLLALAESLPPFDDDGVHLVMGKEDNSSIVKYFNKWATRKHRETEFANEETGDIWNRMTALYAARQDMSRKRKLAYDHLRDALDQLMKHSVISNTIADVIGKIRTHLQPFKTLIARDGVDFTKWESQLLFAGVNIRDLEFILYRTNIDSLKEIIKYLRLFLRWAISWTADGNTETTTKYANQLNKIDCDFSTALLGPIHFKGNAWELDTYWYDALLDLTRDQRIRVVTLATESYHTSYEKDQFETNREFQIYIRIRTYMQSKHIISNARRSPFLVMKDYFSQLTRDTPTPTQLVQLILNLRTFLNSDLWKGVLNRANLFFRVEYDTIEMWKGVILFKTMDETSLDHVLQNYDKDTFNMVIDCIITVIRWALALLRANWENVKMYTNQLLFECKQQEEHEKPVPMMQEEEEEEDRDDILENRWGLLDYQFNALQAMDSDRRTKFIAMAESIDKNFEEHDLFGIIFDWKLELEVFDTIRLFTMKKAYRDRELTQTMPVQQDDYVRLTLSFAYANDHIYPNRTHVSLVAPSVPVVMLRKRSLWTCAAFVVKSNKLSSRYPMAEKMAIGNIINRPHRSLRTLSLEDETFFPEELEMKNNANVNVPGKFKLTSLLNTLQYNEIVATIDTGNGALDVAWNPREAMIVDSDVIIEIPLKNVKDPKHEFFFLSYQNMGPAGASRSLIAFFVSQHIKSKATQILGVYVCMFLGIQSAGDAWIVPDEESDYEMIVGRLDFINSTLGKRQLEMSEPYYIFDAAESWHNINHIIRAFSSIAKAPGLKSALAIYPIETQERISDILFSLMIRMKNTSFHTIFAGVKRLLDEEAFEYFFDALTQLLELFYAVMRGGGGGEDVSNFMEALADVDFAYVMDDIMTKQDMETIPGLEEEKEDSLEPMMLESPRQNSSEDVPLKSLVPKKAPLPEKKEKEEEEEDSSEDVPLKSLVPKKARLPEKKRVPKKAPLPEKKEKEEEEEDSSEDVPLKSLVPKKARLPEKKRVPKKARLPEKKRAPKEKEEEELLPPDEFLALGTTDRIRALRVLLSDVKERIVILSHETVTSIDIQMQLLTTGVCVVILSKDVSPAIRRKAGWTIYDTFANENVVGGATVIQEREIVQSSTVLSTVDREWLKEGVFKNSRYDFSPVWKLPIAGKSFYQVEMLPTADSAKVDMTLSGSEGSEERQVFQLNAIRAQLNTFVWEYLVVRRDLSALHPMRWFPHEDLSKRLLVAQSGFKVHEVGWPPYELIPMTIETYENDRNTYVKCAFVDDPDAVTLRVCPGTHNGKIRQLIDAIRADNDILEKGALETLLSEFSVHVPASGPGLLLWESNVVEFEGNRDFRDTDNRTEQSAVFRVLCGIIKVPMSITSEQLLRYAHLKIHNFVMDPLAGSNNSVLEVNAMAPFSDATWVPPKSVSEMFQKISFEYMNDIRKFLAARLSKSTDLQTDHTAAFRLSLHGLVYHDLELDERLLASEKQFSYSSLSMFQ